LRFTELDTVVLLTERARARIGTDADVELYAGSEPLTAAGIVDGAQLDAVLIAGPRDVPEMLKLMFRIFDADNSGTITLQNLKDIAKQVGSFLADKDSMLQQMILSYAAHGDGGVNEARFLHAVSNHPRLSKDCDESVIFDIWRERVAAFVSDR